MTKEEFKKEVIPLGEKLYRMSYRLLNDVELSKDCVQESFVKLWENRDKLKQVENLQAYAFTIVRNISIDKIRKIKRVSESAKNIPVQPFNTNDDFVESKFFIEKFIQNLPHQQKLVIELRDMEGFSYEEIANILNLSINNIRVNLSIARKKIKEEVIKIYNYGLTKN